MKNNVIKIPEDETSKNEITKDEQKQKSNYFSSGPFASHIFVFHQNNQKISSCGYNDYNQIGMETANERIILSPIKIFEDKNLKIIKISAGSHYCLWLASDFRSVYVSGSNSSGQLGLGFESEKVNFQLLHHKFSHNIQQIECGLYSSYILLSNGDLFSTGDNSCFQLGHSHQRNVSKFQKIKFNEKIKKVRSGSWFLIIQNEKNKLFGVGNNEFGSLGIGNFKKEISELLQIPFFHQIKDFKCGSNHTLILTKEGKVFGTGWNGNGQLGTGDLMKRNTITQVKFDKKVENIYAGFEHSMIITSEYNEIFSFGRNSLGRLGIGSKEYSVTFPQNIKFHFFGDSNIIQIYLSRVNSYFITEIEGKVYSCGYHGVLGSGNVSKSNRSIPGKTKFESIYSFNQALNNVRNSLMNEKNLLSKVQKFIFFTKLANGNNCEVEIFDALKSPFLTRLIQNGVFKMEILESFCYRGYSSISNIKTWLTDGEEKVQIKDLFDLERTFRLSQKLELEHLSYYLLELTVKIEKKWKEEYEEKFLKDLVILLQILVEENEQDEKQISNLPFFNQIKFLIKRNLKKINSESYCFNLVKACEKLRKIFKTLKIEKTTNFTELVEFKYFQRKPFKEIHKEHIFRMYFDSLAKDLFIETKNEEIFQFHSSVLFKNEYIKRLYEQRNDKNSKILKVEFPFVVLFYITRTLYGFEVDFEGLIDKRTLRTIYKYSKEFGLKQLEEKTSQRIRDLKENRI